MRTLMAWGGPAQIATWLLPALVGVGQACNGDSRFNLPVEPASPDINDATACTAWAKSFCAYQELCDYFVWENVDQCVAREVLSCELIAADPDVIFDEERVSGCKYPEDCESAIPQCWGTGRSPAGSPCLWDQACQSGGCLGSDPSASTTICGVCGGELGQPCASASGCFSNSCGAFGTAQPGQEVCGPFAKLGDACGEGMPFCGPSLACSDPGEGAFRCVAPTPYALPGQPCEASLLCLSGVCAAGEAGAKECAPFASLGAACGTNLPYCAGGLECSSQEDDAETGHCIVAPLTGYGAGCNPMDDTCTGFGVCLASCASPPDGGGGWCCAAPVGDGDSCSDTQEVGCLPPAQCIAGRCIFPTVADCSP
jgi:hypothetical protein